MSRAALAKEVFVGCVRGVRGGGQDKRNTLLWRLPAQGQQRSPRVAPVALRTAPDGSGQRLGYVEIRVEACPAA